MIVKLIFVVIIIISSITIESPMGVTTCQVLLETHYTCRLKSSHSLEVESYVSSGVNF